MSAAPQPLGKLEAFWRYSAALGPQMESGYPLLEIPDCLARGDFPYRKRPYPKEVPYADHLSIVRLLGGYDDGSEKGQPNPAIRERDLAYRDDAGKIRYRLHLLKPRLQPYLEHGYTNLTLVLDNVPWCFPEKPTVGPYGQSAPPRDPREWHDFVKALGEELVKLMGPKAAGQLRFRVGTENNGRERFNGAHEQYLRHYDHAAAAVQSVLPSARIGPFNISGVSRRGLEKLHNVRAFDLAAHCLQEPSLATGKTGTPFDWVAFSRYYAPGNDPEASARICREVWDEFERRFPALKGVSREIHEFGVAPFGEAAKGQFVSAEPGALGAALTAQMIFRLRQAGIHRLWHWGVADPFRDRQGRLQHLYTSQAWLMSILDHAAGGEAYLLEAAAPSPSRTRHAALASLKQDEAIVIISAYHTNVAVHTAEAVTLPLPDTFRKFSGKSLRQVTLDRQTAPHDQVRRDLAEGNLLKADFIARPDRLGNIREMGMGRPAEQRVGERFADYARAWESILTLKPLETGRGELRHTPAGWELRVQMAPPEVLVLVFGRETNR